MFLVKTRIPSSLIVRMMLSLASVAKRTTILLARVLNRVVCGFLRDTEKLDGQGAFQGGTR